MFYSVKILVLIFEKYFSSELKIMSNNLFCEKQGVLSIEVSILRLCFKIVLFNHYNCNCFVKINSFKRVKKVFKLVLSWGFCWGVVGENLRRSNIEKLNLFQKLKTAFCKFWTSVKISISMILKLFSYSTKSFI